MELLDELIERLTDEKTKAGYSKAKTERICLLCQNPALAFRTTVAKLEYEISGLCQDCQDKYFR